jgi:hypothetical protein
MGLRLPVFVIPSGGRPHRLRAASRLVRFAGPIAVVLTSMLLQLLWFLPRAAATMPSTRLTIGSAPAIQVGASDLGPVPVKTNLSLTVLMRSRDSAGLSAFVSAVSDPRSPTFRRYLSVDQFAARFGAAPSTISMVRRGLASGTEASLDIEVIAGLAPLSTIDVFEAQPAAVSRSGSTRPTPRASPLEASAAPVSSTSAFGDPCRQSRSPSATCHPQQTSFSGTTAPAGKRSYHNTPPMAV